MQILHISSKGQRAEEKNTNLGCDNSGYCFCDLSFCRLAIAGVVRRTFQPLYTQAIERFKNFRTCDHRENDSSQKKMLVQGDDSEAVPDASKVFFATTP